MDNGRNEKIKPMGFVAAATVLTADFSPEAARHFIQMVKDVAGENDHNDSVAINRLRARLTTAARRKSTATWASEALDRVAEYRHSKRFLEGAVI